jgi:succinyl-diaminopimelate desuccinylase
LGLLYRRYNMLYMKELLKKLIQAKSTPDVGEINCANVLADFFLAAGIKPKVDVWDGNRANLTARLESTDQKPALLFVSHLDVVPAEKQGWQFGAFAAAEHDGKIYGRGSCDMKAGMAATASAMTEILLSKVRLKGDVIFAATAGEETDSIGIKRFLESFAVNKPKICGAIVPEPTNLELGTAHRGLLWLEVKTKGKTAHGSMPQLGINAIELMREFLNELAHYDITAHFDKLLGSASISVNKISGGAATNIVPDTCRAQIDIRTLPEQNHHHMVEDLEGIFSKLLKQNSDFCAKLKILRDVAALATDPDCEFVSQIKQLTNKSGVKAVPFATDAPFLAELNIPVIVFGPGKPQLCHKPDEFIEIENLRRGAELYKEIILHFLV